jgi:hypothetical protein
MSTTTNANATTKPTTFEDKIRQCATLNDDGSEKDFAGVETDDIYHDDIIGTDCMGPEPMTTSPSAATQMPPAPPATMPPSSAHDGVEVAVFVGVVSASLFMFFA